MNPTGSFIRFTLGFLVFIGVSFVVTLTIDKYATSQDSAQTAAAGTAVENRQ
ncbi:MAG: hypothetical protein Q8Q13_00510 [bacterium]|nr:hypothetical protein [bacterium]